jgi:hypothetical protein
MTFDFGVKSRAVCHVFCTTTVLLCSYPTEGAFKYNIVHKKQITESISCKYFKLPQFLAYNVTLSSWRPGGRVPWRFGWPEAVDGSRGASPREPSPPVYVEKGPKINGKKTAFCRRFRGNFYRFFPERREIASWRYVIFIVDPGDDVTTLGRRTNRLAWLRQRRRAGNMTICCPLRG